MKGLTGVPIYRYAHVHIYIYIYLSVLWEIAVADTVVIVG